METEIWKSPRKLQEEADLAYAEKQEQRRALRMKVGTALCDVVLDGLMEPTEAQKFFVMQFPEMSDDRTRVS